MFLIFVNVETVVYNYVNCVFYRLYVLYICVTQILIFRIYLNSILQYFVYYFYSKRKTQSFMFKFAYMDRRLPDFGFHILYYFMAIFKFLSFINLIFNFFS